MAIKKDKIMLADGFPALPDFDELGGGGGSDTDTQSMIAYVQKTLKADKAYSAGDYFIYDADLYAATASIAKDADIVLTGAGANAEQQDPSFASSVYPLAVSTLGLSSVATPVEAVSINTQGSNVMSVGNRTFVNVNLSVSGLITAKNYVKLLTLDPAVGKPKDMWYTPPTIAWNSDVKPIGKMSVKYDSTNDCWEIGIITAETVSSGNIIASMLELM